MLWCGATNESDLYTHPMSQADVHGRISKATSNNFEGNGNRKNEIPEISDFLLLNSKTPHSYTVYQ